MAIYFTQNTNNVEDIEQMNNVIDKVNKVNTEATSNIGQLIDLNNKAQELSNNIQEALPINTELKENIKIGQPLAEEATQKNTELQASLEEAKEFIDGLDGSQNIPGIRMELTELQNGLKSNQALEYQGSSISAENTLGGRTEGMKIKGRTLNNLYKANNIREDAGGKYILVDTLVKDEPKDRVVYIVNNTNRILLLNVYKISGGWDSNPIIRENSISKLDLTGKKLTGFLGMYDRGWTNSDADKELLRNTCIVLDREETYIPQKYFEGLKSFGEEEKEGDKYKISILSSGKNLGNIDKMIEIYSRVDSKNLKKQNNGFCIAGALFHGYSKDVFELKYKPNTQYRFKYHYKRTTADYSHFFQIVYTDGTTTQYYAPPDNLEFDVNLLSTNGKTIDYIKTSYSASNGWSEFSNIILTEGTKDYIFEPYQSNKKDILIKEPLRSVGDISDIMYEDNGQVKVNRIIGEHVVTGDENFITELRNDYLYGYFTLEGSKAGSGLEAICNKFKYIDGLWNKDNLNVQGKEGFDLSGSNSLSFQLPISKLETADTSGLKKYFKNLYNSNNPVIVYYQLATPITELYENCVDIDLDTYQEKTYFNILNSLPGTLDFKVPSNIASIVQSNSKAINELYDLINNVVMPGMAEIIDKTVKASMNLAK